jgi:hypothetical protein
MRTKIARAAHSQFLFFFIFATQPQFMDTPTVPHNDHVSGEMSIIMGYCFADCELISPLKSAYKLFLEVIKIAVTIEFELCFACDCSKG